MIIKDKIKSKLKAKSKILVLGFVTLIILAGLFGSAGNARAQTPQLGTCTTTQSGIRVVNPTPVPKASCTGILPQWDPLPASGTDPIGDCVFGNGIPPSPNTLASACTANGGTPVPSGAGAASTTTSTASGQSTFEQQFSTAITCVTGPVSINVGGCLVSISYYLFYVVPSWLLIVSANFFNALIAISLSSTLFANSTFIPTAWAVVRDLSNIFFILVLLYIAIRLILGIGGSEGKKMIVQVIIMALLINFSMFFTQVIIDSSNILALVFYNKLDVKTKNADGSTRDYTPVTNANDKDLSGAMVNAFNPTSQLTWDNFFKAARDPVGQYSQVGTAQEKGTCATPLLGIKDLGLYTKAECEQQNNDKALGRTWTPLPLNKNADGSSSLAEIPSGIMLGLILVTGLVMLFASYCFFIAGISFVGRLIELWILIIFSPFAFMSSTIPILNDIEYIGWKAWLHRLLTVAFMAPIFMFFLYFIFMLINAKLFDNLINGKSMVQTMLLIIIPAIILLILLLKATDFAKKGSGKLGEMLIKGTEIAMGVAAGVTFGVAAKGLQGTVGQVSSRMANSEWAKKREAEGKFGGVLFRKTTQGLAKSSFDVRQGAVGGVLAAAGGVSGLNLGHSSKLFKEAGGFEADKKKKIEDRQKRAEDLKVGPDEKQTQDLRQVEGAHQELLQRDGNAHEVGLLDTKIKTLGVRAADASRQARTNGTTNINPSTGKTYGDDAIAAENALKDANGEGLAIKNASMFRTSDGKIIDHRNATTNENLSEDAITGIENTANAAIHAVANTEIARARQALTKAGTNVSEKETEANDAIAALAANTDPTKIATLTATKDTANKAYVEAGQQYVLADNALTATLADPKNVIDATAADNSAAIAIAARDAAYATRDVTLIAERDATAAAAIANPTDAALARAAAAAAAAATAANVTASTATAQASAAHVTALAAAPGADAGLVHAGEAATNALLKVASGLSGRSINNLEDTDIPAAHHHVEAESKQRARNYADVVETGTLQSLGFFNAGGRYFFGGGAQKEAAHNIRMGAKLDSGTGGKGGGH